MIYKSRGNTAGSNPDVEFHSRFRRINTLEACDATKADKSDVAGFKMMHKKDPVKPGPHMRFKLTAYLLLCYSNKLLQISICYMRFM